MTSVGYATTSAPMPTAAERQDTGHLPSINADGVGREHKAKHTVLSSTRLAWQQRRPRLLEGTPIGEQSPLHVGHPPLHHPMTRYLRIVDREELATRLSTYIWESTCIGSYSCHSSSTSTDTRIVIPAKPPVYVPRTGVEEIHLAKSLAKGLGQCRGAINHYDLAHPLETLQHVVSHCTPTFDWSKVSLVTNRGHLTDLLRFITGAKLNSFEFTMSCGGEGQPAVVDRSWKYHGREPTYGWAFEEAMTRPQSGAEQLIRHHRVSLIRLGGLHLVVRAEVDACAGQADKQGIRQLSDGDWELCEDGTSRLWCAKSGIFDPMETAVELKTSSVRRSLGAKVIYEQMLLGDSKLLVAGKHFDGNLVDITELSIEELYASGGDAGCRDREMAQLGELLEILLEVAKVHGHIVVVWNGRSRKLIIRERQSR